MNDPKKLTDEIDELKRQVRSVGNMVELSITRAIMALQQHDRMLAGAVIKADNNIDLKEVEVEELCLRILTEHQPTGASLRFVVAALKINNDLERIGDLAVNIAEFVCELVHHEHLRRIGGCGDMAKKAETMVHRALQSLIDADVDMARKVIFADDEVDRLEVSIGKRVEAELDRRPENAGTLLKLAHIVRQLERIGDAATNIAEDVIYMVEDRIVRHPRLRNL